MTKVRLCIAYKGGVLLHISNSDTFKSTTNSDTLEKQNYHY